jgi:hypothetical protein
VKQVVFDGECEPVPMIVALVDEPPRSATRSRS